MFNASLYALALIFLVVSYSKDKKKTKQALKKAWKSFENILPQFLSIILLIGLTLSFVDEEFIIKALGEESGVWGMMVAGLVGSVTLIPAFVAYPLAAALLDAGAGYVQITILITTLMMVGIITLPLEIKYFNKKTALKRNGIAFIYAILMSLMVGALL